MESGGEFDNFVEATVVPQNSPDQTTTTTTADEEEEEFRAKMKAFGELKKTWESQ